MSREIWNSNRMRRNTDRADNADAHGYDNPGVRLTVKIRPIRVIRVLFKLNSGNMEKYEEKTP